MRNRMQKTGYRVAVAASLAALLVGPASAVVTIQVSTSDGAPGGTVILGLGLRRDPGDRSVATAQTDVIVQTNQMKLVGTCAGTTQACSAADECGESGTCTLPCEKEARLTQHSFAATLPAFQNLPAGQQRFRMAIVDTQFPIDTLTDGALATCVLHVPDNAALAPLIVTTDRLNVGDERGNVVPAEVEIAAGMIKLRTPTPTATITQTLAPSATATPVGTLPTSTPTPTRTGGSPTPDTAPCPAQRPAPSGPALYVADQTLAAGATSGTIEVRLAASDSQVAGTQNDLELPANIRIKAKANGRPDCTVNSAINKGGTSFAFRPTGCNPAAGECSVRALVLSTEDTNPITLDLLYSCNVTVASRGGGVAVTGVILSTPEGTRVPGASGRSGVICVEASITPTPTPTPSSRPATPTPTITVRTPATLTPTTVATATSTVRATATRTLIPATNTPALNNGGGGGGGGCNCAVSPAEAANGLSSMWLALPALLLQWRRRRR